MSLPLEGVRIVELGTVISGPYATTLLADLGADVIKVEPPGGDAARDLGPRRHEGMAAVFLNCNRGKRSVVLDLATDDGRRALKELTEHADAFITNLRAESARRCGADPETLQAGNERLVYCIIRGFGADGPYADLPAYDDIAQAASGIAGQQEWTAGEPRYVVSAVGDKVSGLTAAFAIAAALREQAVNDHGTVIEVPMVESLAAFAMLEHQWGHTFSPPIAPVGYPRMASLERRPFPTADGWISVVVYSAKNWQDFFAIIGQPELGDDPRFGTLEGRTAHVDTLYVLVADHLRRDTTEAWFEKLRAVGIPAVPYNRPDELFDDPHLEAVGFWTEHEHPTEGTLLQAVTPLTFDGEHPGIGRPVPELGADTDAVFAELGITPPASPTAGP